MHKKPDNLPRGKTETDIKAWERLTEFRQKVELSHTCVFWENADELKSLLIIGLTKTIRTKPAVGWVRADKIPEEDTLKEILALRNKNQELENMIKSETFNMPKGTENLDQGEDVFKVKCSFTAEIPNSKTLRGYENVEYTGTMRVTWNKIWAAIFANINK